MSAYGLRAEPGHLGNWYLQRVGEELWLRRGGGGGGEFECLRTTRQDGPTGGRIPAGVGEGEGERGGQTAQRGHCLDLEFPSEHKVSSNLKQTQRRGKRSLAFVGLNSCR